MLRIYQYQNIQGKQTIKTKKKQTNTKNKTKKQQTSTQAHKPKQHKTKIYKQANEEYITRAQWNIVRNFS